MKVLFIKSILLVGIYLCQLAPIRAQVYKEILLNEFNPKSIYKIPITKTERAKYSAIDMHSHDYPRSDQEVDEWVKTMDACNIEKTIILSYSTGTRFDSIVTKYARYKTRFEVWCGFDYTGHQEPGWIDKAVKELVRCHSKGATGVGELGDKGLGELYSHPTPGYGIHINDPKMQALIRKCGELDMPISIHVAEDAWMYEPPDETNDGLINAGKWNVDMSKKGILNHDQLVQTLEDAVKMNPGTTFIACHLANCCSDLSRLAKMFDAYPNLYAEMAARFGEIAPIPRQVKAFMEKYKNRLLYGTDMGTSSSMYRSTFRILETADEHFYERSQYNYHWPLHGLNLSDQTLKKIYNGNARKILK